MTAVAEGEPQQLLQLLLLLPPVLVASAGAVAALTPKMRMIAASRMRMAVSPSGIFPRRKGLSPGRGAVKGGFCSGTCPHPGPPQAGEGALPFSRIGRSKDAHLRRALREKVAAAGRRMRAGRRA